MKKIQKTVAKVALKVTEVTENSACACIFHQEKMPANAKKLRKF